MRSRIYLRQPRAADRAAFLAAAARSTRLHGRWVRAPATAAEYRRYCRRMARPENRAYLVCRRDSDEIAGVINLTNMILGAFRSGYLGYYAFAGHEGQGLMRAGLAAVVRDAFKSLKLHRLEANIQPGNRASLGLVGACGFSREGYSPRYLKIAGRWRDHERWAIVAD
jgi:ribosomal-protein-alanine N-acetyltransferase